MVNKTCYTRLASMCLNRRLQLRLSITSGGSIIMKTILITGGASGIGKGIAMQILKKGDRVIAIGSSKANGNTFIDEARQIGATDRAFYTQANLSLEKENRRIIKEVKESFQSLNALILCATKHSKIYTETEEGLELTFALDYLSRFVLSYGLKESLEITDNPIILNVCGSGMKGNIDWNDLQHKNSFESQKVMMHGSRLNDLLGVGFVQNDTVGKIKYIMYNPWAVQTPSMMEMFSSPIMKLMYKIIGKTVEQAAILMAELLDNPPSVAISAYRERKKLSLDHPSYNSDNAKRLYNLTVALIKDLSKQ